ncbi:MAG: hypothetical protein KDB27_20465 [Planctomycetales bacterium]|nr:hypothetical protein [Planctomycetales bacterium]
MITQPNAKAHEQILFRPISARTNTIALQGLLLADSGSPCLETAGGEPSASLLMKCDAVMTRFNAQALLVA